MTKLSCAAVLLSSAISFANVSFATEAVPKIPLADFFKNPEIIQVRISPDGKHLAWLAPYENRLNLFVKSTAPGAQAERLTSMTDRGIQKIYWKGSAHVLFERDLDGDENNHIFSAEISGGGVRDLTPFAGSKSMLQDGLDNVSATDILISNNKRNPEVFDIYRLNVATGEMILKLEADANSFGYMNDSSGVIRLAFIANGLNTDILYRRRESDSFKKIMSVTYNDHFDPLLFSYDNPDEIYVSSNLGRDKSALVLFNLRTQKEVKVIYADPDVDVGTLGHNETALFDSYLQKKIVMLAYRKSQLGYHFFDAKMAAIYADMRKQLPAGVEINLKGSTSDEKKFMFAIQSDRHFATYYLYDTTVRDARHRMVFLADSAPWLKDEQMAKQVPVSYRARDGVTIHGYLTLPTTGVTKNLPVIMNPHGGPWGVRDQWGFHPEIQFLANRGYAVLQMNYRGSAGYGRHFTEISYKQWGRAMQDDITDGVHWLIKQGIADPKRVGIYGGSYGGYATLAGIAFTPDLYAVAVDEFGVSNLFTFLKTIPPYWKVGQEQYRRRLGDPEKDHDLLAAASPALHVDQIKTPLLVAQGAKDVRVSIHESDQIVEALRAQGSVVEYMVFPNEGHGFANQENEFKFYAALEEFLAKYLHP